MLCLVVLKRATKLIPNSCMLSYVHVWLKYIYKFQLKLLDKITSRVRLEDTLENLKPQAKLWKSRKSGLNSSL